MSSIADKFDKKWIYIPIYIGVLIAAIWMLNSYMNPKLEHEAELIESSGDEIPEDFLRCFIKNKKSIGGTIDLMPPFELTDVFMEFDEACFDEVCETLEDVNSGAKTVKEFYKLAENIENCVFPVLNESVKYHIGILEKSPLMGVFFNSGQVDLLAKQRSEIVSFVDKNGVQAGNQGLLIIGRASNIGRAETNANLSRKRSESINAIVDRYFENKINTDFIYFGDAPPQLNKNLADRFGLDILDYKNISYGSGSDTNYKLRLNQSVLLVFYDLEKDPFYLN